MKKEIKDYLHLYLGCDVSYDGKEYVLESLQRYGLKYPDAHGCFIMIDADDCLWVSCNDIKPILRKLDSMTEEEKHELCKILHPKNTSLTPLGQEQVSEWFLDISNEAPDETIQSFAECVPFANQAKAFMYLLSKGFDLFDLIESGLAIEHKLETT